MFGQPSQAIAVDFWTLIPVIRTRSAKSSAYGHFVQRGGAIEIVSRKQKSAGDYWFFLVEQPPLGSEDFATGVIILDNQHGLVRLILLLGYPNGFGEYQWHGICPHTLRPAQMLYLDPGTQLFVSRAALGKSPPASMQRANDDSIILDKVVKKCGKFDWRDFSSYPSIAKDSDFAGLDDSGLINLVVWDFFFANSGYPIPVLKDDGAIDVLATIQNSKNRQRRPAKLLRPNRGKPIQPPRTYKTVEEVLKRMKERKMPIPPEFEQQLREHFNAGKAKPRGIENGADIAVD